MATQTENPQGTNSQELTMKKALSKVSTAKSGHLRHSMQNVSIFERDKFGEVLMCWCYPSLSDELRKVESRRCPLGGHNNSVQNQLFQQYEKKKSQNEPLFLFSRYQDEFLYSYSFAANQEDNQNKYVTDICIFIASTEYYPDKYEAYLKAMKDVYLSNNQSPVKILEVYLSLYGRGKYKGYIEKDQFQDSREGKIANLKQVCQHFNAEDCAKMWTALLLKKRVLVYSDNIDQLQDIVKGISMFIFHREQQNTFSIEKLVRPFVDFEHELEMADLKEHPLYVVGTLNPQMKNNVKWYDLLVDVPMRRTVVPERLLDDFQLTKIHRDLISKILSKVSVVSHASSLKTKTEAAPQMTPSSSIDNITLIKQIATKTKEYLQKLTSLKEQDQEKITYEQLQVLSLQQDLERFLYKFGISEYLIA